MTLMPVVDCVFPADAGPIAPGATGAAAAIPEPSDADAEHPSDRFDPAAIPAALVFVPMPFPVVQTRVSETRRLHGSGSGEDGLHAVKGENSAPGIGTRRTNGRQTVAPNGPLTVPASQTPHIAVSLSVAPFEMVSQRPANARFAGHQPGKPKPEPLTGPPAGSIGFAPAALVASPGRDRNTAGEASAAASAVISEISPIESGEPLPFRNDDCVDGEGGDIGIVAGARRQAAFETAPTTARQMQPAGSPMLFAAPVQNSENGANAATAAAPAPAFAMSAPDRAEAVATVVDRLMAARDVGLGAFASVAIDHHEFGELTVNFASKGERLEVSIDAADGDKQRALAASLVSQDRQGPRETLAQVAPTSSHTGAPMSSDRGADGHAARSGAHQQAHDQSSSDPRRRTRSPAEPVVRQSAEPDRGGIYV